MGDENSRESMKENGEPRTASDSLGGDSVSRPHTGPQPARDERAGRAHRDGGRETPQLEPDAGESVVIQASGRPRPTAHVVLYQPEIPQNTGNIGRTCVATGAKLWIVRPAAFQFDEKRLRRAGLDYWQYLDFQDVNDWNELTTALAGKRFFFFSRFAKRLVWDAELRRDDVFVFGRESSGLPASILDPADERSLRLPTSPQVRSLNLATTVGIVLYEQMRQIGR